MAEESLITVITVVYNDCNRIEKTIQSIINQTYKNIEFIIIDGGSSDGTVDIVKKYNDYLNYWVSEPNNGLYDAMNKGIDKAKGLYTIFIRAGNYLYDHSVFERLVNSIHTLPSHEIIYTRSKIINQRGDITDLTIYNNAEKLWRMPFFYYGTLLTKTSLLKDNKLELSESLKLVSFNDFLYKMHKNGSRFSIVNIITLNFFQREISTNPYHLLKGYNQILKRHGDWDIKSKVRYVYKYCSLIVNQSFFKYIFKIIHIFFHNYFSNYWINKIPFYFIRHSYYKILGVKIGRGSSIHLNCYLFGNKINMAENSTVNRNCYLDGRGWIFIGNNVSISPEVHLITEDHDYNSSNFSGRSRDIVIEDYVWIGTRAIILPGVHIGRGAVVSAGAVVTKNVKEFDVVAGVPAVKIRERNKNINYSSRWFYHFD